MGKSNKKSKKQEKYVEISGAIWWHKDNNNRQINYKIKLIGGAYEKRSITVKTEAKGENQSVVLDFHGAGVAFVSSFPGVSDPGRCILRDPGLVGIELLRGICWD